MRPKPTIPTVAPCRSRPSSSPGSQVRHSPARTKASPSARRRAIPSISASARSAVDSVSTPGVLPTGNAARARRVEVDVVGAHRVVRDRPQPRGGRDQLGVDGVGEQRQQPLELRRAPQQLLARRRQALGPNLHLVRRRQPVERVTGQAAGHEHALAGMHERGAWHERQGRCGRTPRPARHSLRWSPTSSRARPTRSSSRRRLRSFGARVEVYSVEDVARALAAEPSRLVVAGGDGSIAPVAAAAG